MKMSLDIFTSAKVFPSAVNSTFQFFITFIIKFMTFLDILYILGQSITHVFWDHIIKFLVDFLEDMLINVQEAIGSSCSPVASFLIFQKQSAAYKRIIDLFLNLCSQDFAHHWQTYF